MENNKYSPVDATPVKSFFCRDADEGHRFG